jgi:hypothetical protein
VTVGTPSSRWRARTVSRPATPLAGVTPSHTSTAVQVASAELPVGGEAGLGAEGVEDGLPAADGGLAEDAVNDERERLRRGGWLLAGEGDDAREGERAGVAVDVAARHVLVAIPPVPGEPGGLAEADAVAGAEGTDAAGEGEGAFGGARVVLGALRRVDRGRERRRSGGAEQGSRGAVGGGVRLEGGRLQLDPERLVEGGDDLPVQLGEHLVVRVGPEVEAAAGRVAGPAEFDLDGVGAVGGNRARSVHEGVGGAVERDVLDGVHADARADEDGQVGGLEPGRVGGDPVAALRGVSHALGGAVDLPGEAGLPVDGGAAGSGQPEQRHGVSWWSRTSKAHRRSGRPAMRDATNRWRPSRMR